MNREDIQIIFPRSIDPIDVNCEKYWEYLAANHSYLSVSAITVLFLKLLRTGHLSIITCIFKKRLGSFVALVQLECQMNHSDYV